MSSVTSRCPAPPAPPTGTQALNAALAAGFEIIRHAATTGYYLHELRHPDGRSLAIRTQLGGARFLHAQSYNRSSWNTTTLSARSVPALNRLLGAS